MKNQNGKTPLGWIITIAITLLIMGAVVAMIFVDNEQISDKIHQYQNKNNVQTEQNK